MSEGDSYVVTKYGLDGLREHWMPGNRKKGTGPREKRGFETERLAREWLLAREMDPDSRVYRCPHCNNWHTASPERR